MRDRRGAYIVFLSISEGKSALGRHTRRWENNIEMYLQEIVLGHELD
jgi:hypothetical protein